ncbi:ImcF-related family protein, partial [Acinetobacter baumannii]
DQLEPALLERYGREFGRSWDTALRSLRIKSLTADRPGYVTLDAAARATSPLIALFESIREETQLTREKPKPAGAAPTSSAPPRVAFPAGVV